MLHSLSLPSHGRHDIDPGTPELMNCVVEIPQGSKGAGDAGENMQRGWDKLSALASVSASR